MYQLTEDERAAMNSTLIPQHERERLYARDLRHTAECYAKAADAPGLRKDAARYLLSESIRLTNESGLHFDRADELETAHPAAVLIGGRVPEHAPGAYPRLSCCGGPVELVEG